MTARALALLVVGAVVVTACASKTTEQSSEPCSNAERYPVGTQFPFDSGDTRDLPNCTPHCGANSSASPMWGGAYLTSEALPSGACVHDGNACALRAEWVGKACAEGQTPVGPLVTFVCRCAQGSWACAVSPSNMSATMFECH